jgi:lipopolysaccharide assembly outer membrane protein LptD (OstA)
MSKLCRIISLLAWSVLLVWQAPLLAQERPGWEIESLAGEGGVVYDFESGIATATNGVLVKYGPAVLTADSITLNQSTGDVIADGRVRIQRDDLVWASEHVRYNFLTQEIEAEQFRTGKSPVFAMGEGLQADLTNRVYTATNAVLASDDIKKPMLRVTARRIRIIPGQRVEAHNAVLYAGSVPVFWFPYFSRSLRGFENRFDFMPGFRTLFGPFLLSSYNFTLSDRFDGKLHADYRVRRGVGAGPDLNYDLGRWGQGTARYYYLYDQDPNLDAPGADISHHRQRVWFSHLANPATNLSVRSVVRYQSDTNVIREFFESEYRENPQPSTFVEANKLWPNFSLDLYAQPRVNDWLETVERLPDVRLTAYRQRVGPLPIYYESETSAGWYRHRFPDEPPSLIDTNYSGARADTYHQMTVPQTLFGWLNIVPRVGGRYTYYGEASGPGKYTDEQSRVVFNTGAELTFKASQVWPSIRSGAFEIDGLRHLLEPSINYVYIPEPNVRPHEVPRFDAEYPSLRLLPIDFPDYNSIDSIDAQNATRLGVRNRFQTKRNGQVANVLDWSLYTDLRIDPRADQTRFSDVYSDVLLMPQSWLRLESFTRYDTDAGQWRMSYNAVTLQPNDRWEWSVGHFYLRNDFTGLPTELGEGNDLITSVLYFKLNENWGFRTAHRYDVRNDFMQEQAYSIYRDMRSWTAALTLRYRETLDRRDDLTVAFTFSLKAFPRRGLGYDTIRPYTLWGY